MSVGLIIFDLDGTLIDSLEDITGALNEALESFRLPPLKVPEVAPMIGEGALKLVQRVLKKYGASLDPGPIVARYTEAYASHLAGRTTLYPGAKEMLEQLASFKKALISNKSEALSRALLTHFGLSGYFNILVGADTIPERKPSPAPLFHVLSALAASPKETIMVGDSEVDIWAGKAASVKTIAVTHGYGSPGFEKEADFVVGSLLPLAHLIKQIDSAPNSPAPGGS
jgi:phosphoglycolate phosphatase